MGLRSIRIGAGATALLLAASGACASLPAWASAAGAPAAGDWEGTGPYGLPLSFDLERRHDRLVATAITLGAPSVCPPNERDSEALAMFGVSYSGPGGAAAPPGTAPGVAILSGRLPGQSGPASIGGRFSTARSGNFSALISSSVGCGSPKRVLSWRVHAAHRQAVSDGTWTATLTGPGITSGAVTLTVTSSGRVVRSFSAAFQCSSPTLTGENSLNASPADEFIRPDGRFASALTGNAMKGVPTTWSGRFSPAGTLAGTLSIYDPCTNAAVQAQFNGRRHA